MKKERNYKKHEGTKRVCDFCKETYDVKNIRQRFCKRECYMAWHSREKNEQSNAKRRNDGKYVWKHLKLRCEDPENKAYKNYGGKGVECKFESFEDFQSVYFRTNECENCAVPLNDENRRARDGRNINRIDSNGHYEVDNVDIVCKACNNYRDRNDKRGWL